MPEALTTAAAGALVEVALPNPDFTGLCLGDFGAGVIRAYEEQALVNPILNPCREVSKTPGRARDVFHARTEPEAVATLAMCLDSKFCCLALESSAPASTAMAMHFAEMRQARGGSRKYTVAIVPDDSAVLEAAPFDLILETESTPWAAASTLLTLRNTWLGCGNFGNLMCMKVIMPDLRNWVGVARVRSQIFQLDYKGVGNSETVSKNVMKMMDGFHGKCCTVILELPDDSVSKGFKILDLAFDAWGTLSREIESHDTIRNQNTLIHLSRSLLDCKATVWLG